MSAPASRVLVSVGTDHHPFDRLLAWIEDAAARHPGCTFTVQSGATTPRPGLPSSAYMPRAEMDAAFAAADVVVCHGGPATINEARRHGCQPIVAPRDPALGEHVDDHQQRYSAALGRAGLVRLAPDRETFDRLLDAAIADPSAFLATEDDQDEIAATVDRIALLVGDLVHHPERRRSAGVLARFLPRPRRIG